MTQSIEEIVGELERTPAIPGTRPGERGKVIYVSLAQDSSPEGAYQKVIRQISPPRMSNGGAMLDDCVITIPNGTHFYPLILNGDINGWKSQIEEGAKELGLFTATIEDNDFFVSNNTLVPLAECTIEFR